VRRVTKLPLAKLSIHIGHLFAVLSFGMSVFSASLAWGGPSFPLEGFVQANGVRLQYLDWGGSGEAMILLHGLADNPHVFDDLAPAFVDRFHVVGYARRGSGSSDAKGPYDVDTLADDLRGLMDALGIEKADLVGASAGGDEITEMAAKHPERVSGIVYLDAGYDWSDPDFYAAYQALPFRAIERPSSATASMNAFRSYQKAMWYPGLDDIRRIEAQLRDSVVIQPDGSVMDRTSAEVVKALYSALFSNKRRDYAHVRCPVLAIYAQHVYDVEGAATPRRHEARAYEEKYSRPFQTKSIDLVGRELANVQVLRVPGAHGSFFLTHRTQVVGAMRRFLTEVGPNGAK
jgi:pimeloyl-ACP methyl ester carboxylesterase